MCWVFIQAHVIYWFDCINVCIFICRYVCFLYVCFIDTHVLTGKHSLKEFCTWCSSCLLAPSRVSQNKIIGIKVFMSVGKKHCRFAAPFSPQRNTSEKSRCNRRIHFAREDTSKTLELCHFRPLPRPSQRETMSCATWQLGWLGLYGKGLMDIGSLKLTFLHLKMGRNPKRKGLFWKIIHFQVLLLLVSGRVSGRIYRTMFDLVLWVLLSGSTVESESCAKDGRNPAPVDR